VNCAVLPPEERDTDIRVARHVLQKLPVLYDGEAPFVNMDEINDESIWVIYWNPPRHQEV
jgi:hypothetical protein